MILSNGTLCWKITLSHRVEAGSEAGLDSRNVFFHKKGYKKHRIIWVLMTGEEPPDLIDHIDGNQKNNAWSNLRAATKSQNMMNRGVQTNNRLGAKGIYWWEKRKKYVVQIKKNRAKVFQGYFDTIEDAKVAHAAAVVIHHGEFGRAA
jgi:hypothetical protein